MDRQNISSGSPLGQPIGFSRAVRPGRHVAVPGTAPVAATACTFVEARLIKDDWLVEIEADAILPEEAA